MGQSNGKPCCIVDTFIQKHTKIKHNITLPEMIDPVSFGYVFLSIT